MAITNYAIFCNIGVITLSKVELMFLCRRSSGKKRPMSSESTSNGCRFLSNIGLMIIFLIGIIRRVVRHYHFDCLSSLHQSIIVSSVSFHQLDKIIDVSILSRSWLTHSILDGLERRELLMIFCRYHFEISLLSRL